MPTTQIVARLRALSPRARLLATFGLLMLVLASLAVTLLTRDTRIALFATPLRADQLAEVEARLAAWNVPYLSTSDNVRVARGKRNELLLRLALAGVPHAHLAGSDEALAKVGALTPQTVLEAQTRDALAADLALGLRGLDGVADTRVVIAPASAGIYADDARRDASASVRVTLATGARLSARAVAGIKAFVAGGVPGLDTERVTVLDDRGLALESDGGEDASDVQTALQSAFDTAFGLGATIVRVHREPVGEQRDVRDVRRAALSGAIARTSTDERYASNVKRYSKSAASEDRGSETREEHRLVTPDATARLSVAVFVDASRRLDVAKIRALAAAAAGIRFERGDAVTVESITFGTGAPRMPLTPTPGWLLAVLSVLPQAATACALVLIVALGARPMAGVATRLVESASARSAARDVAGLPPARVRRALSGEPPHVAAAIISALPTATAAAVLELYPPEERAAIVRRLARGLNPDLVPDPQELLRVHA
jgi:flagellar biosynthesis/type III secretory pathway M-ring protein FliF/YscJ